jgi:predicted peptidase
MRILTSILLSLVVVSSPRLSAQQVQTGFLDRSVTIAGNVCRYNVYVPSNYSTAQQWPVILFLDGAGEHGNDGLLQSNAGTEWLFVQRRRR